MKDKSKLFSRRLSVEQKTQLRQAQSAMRSLVANAKLDPSFGVDEQQVERMHFVQGQELGLSEAFLTHTDDSSATQAYFDDLRQRDPERATLLYLSMSDLTLRSTLWWAARWAQCAHPVANILNEKYLASLCTTTMPEDLVDLVRAPWRAFMIRLSPKSTMFPILFEGGNVDYARRILVHQYTEVESGVAERVFSYVLEGPRLTMDRMHIPVREMCNQTDPDEFSGDTELFGGSGQTCRIVGQDRRVLHMAARVVVGTCAAFNTEGATRNLSQHPKSVRLRKRSFPTKFEFVVGRPVRVDARPYVHSYIEHGSRRGPITTQHLVRGHWKSQPHGPQCSDRKFIHIEPYWRGPEDAPILVRPHVLGMKETQ